MEKKSLKDEAQLEIITTDGETPIRCFISEDHGFYIPLHYHPALEIIYVLEGTVCFSISHFNDTEQLIGKGLSQSTAFNNSAGIPDLRINKLPIYQPIDLAKNRLKQELVNDGQEESIAQEKLLEQENTPQTAPEKDTPAKETGDTPVRKSFKVLGDLPEPIPGISLEEVQKAQGQEKVASEEQHESIS